MSSGQPGIWVSEGEAPADPPVVKVFNRVGEIAAEKGDYDASQVLLDRSGGTETVATAVTDLRDTTHAIIMSLANTQSVQFYEHPQPVASNVWVVQHNLGRRPSVTIVDSAGVEIEGAVRHQSLNQLTIYFGGSCSGTATCS